MIIQAHFRIKILSNISAQEKKLQSIYVLLNDETEWVSLSTVYKQILFCAEKELFKGKVQWWIEYKTKRKLFNCSRYVD